LANPFFEVNGDEIALLDDGSLRDLIGHLCEAEFRRHGRDPSGVLWGGNQDAPDGGFDVYAETEQPIDETAYLNRGRTGFQVKKPGMPPSKIGPEMQPKGQLRGGVKMLIANAGTYIIVSSGDSTSDSALKKRTAAMREAVQKDDPTDKLNLVFLDRGRIATWVRDHPSLVLWVKNRIGRPYNGWRPYERWAWVPEGGTDTYLMDDQVRLFDGQTSGDEGVSAADGIGKLRQELATPRRAVRLTGLSGVGKTRLVQALFDREIGEHALSPSDVFYTDVADSPSPDPQSMIEQLVAQGISATVVVDNCPPELHRQAAKVCARSDSKISLITVEYDVREDLPPETQVYRLEASGSDLIERLVRLHHPHISEVDAGKIAEFSGGNARVADALAGTIAKGETVSGFKDEELFVRLFDQRNQPSGALISSAEALSLVYSFDGEAVDPDSELAILASIAGKNVRILYADAAVLKERSLLQSRGKWRAVLPHAIANRLAAGALRKIPRRVVLDAFLNSGSERLIKSFARRLNFLHDSDDAVQIVKDWLAPDGWIGKFTDQLSPFGMTVLESVAPVCPDETLAAIERAGEGENGAAFTSRTNSHHQAFVRLIRAIGFEARFFERSFRLLSRFALSEGTKENHEPARGELKQMCQLMLSGTWASAEQRRLAISELCEDGSADRQELGLELLDASLESWHFSSAHLFDFGARPRDYGYQPRTQDDVDAWFEVFLGYAKELAVRSDDRSTRAREIIANNFRSLWTSANALDLLETVAHEIHKARPWNEGWIAVRKNLFFDGEKMEPSEKDRLLTLEKALRPTDLIQKTRAYAISRGRYDLDLEEVEAGDEDDTSRGYDRLADISRVLGTDVAKDDDAFQTVLPELFNEGGARLNTFGEGLAIGAPSLETIWDALLRTAKASDPEKRDLSVLLGFLIGAKGRDQAFVDATLDSLLADDQLAGKFPMFQVAAGLDAAGVKRLHASLDQGLAPIWEYERIAWGRAHEPLSDGPLVKLLRRIREVPDGPFVAEDILKMRFHKDPGEKKRHGETLFNFGRELLAEIPLDRDRRGNDLHAYDLATLSRETLKGKKGEAAARRLCERLRDGAAAGDVHLFHFPKLLGVLADLHPTLFLDAFLDDHEAHESGRRRFFRVNLERQENPFSKIDDEVLLDWCSKRADVRFLRIAQEAVFFHRPESKGAYEWKPLFFKLVGAAPNKETVLKVIAEGIRPWSWSGSFYVHLEERANLFVDLLEHEDATLCTWARDTLSWLRKWIDEERQREEEENRSRDESFE
tara:strand:+ start:895 stop:4734 length:3840 start_codon:yes stop_codon:yes gene_type:complete